MAAFSGPFVFAELEISATRVRLTIVRAELSRKLIGKDVWYSFIVSGTVEGWVDGQETALDLGFGGGMV